ncbi:hypothetical protein SEA_SKOG_202 [Gordonia phage Skog]|uniref:Uncharacterized protein n=1 Tax=Gordonia phage Skog TaxID=2704033 RepID=A0A6G6XK13_9CAUD|nr:hypothetical protein KHQ85_gp202 [Gordonia phage Skog]QIG58354.1 hypothetical protein SEA_SKOG_202 [Gordonia phage Skog]
MVTTPHDKETTIMAKNELASSDLRDILSAHDGDYAAAYREIVRAAKAADVARAPRSTVTSRRKAWEKAIKVLDRTKLAVANKTLQGYVRKVRANSEITHADPHILDVAEADALMEEFLDLKQIEDFIKARYGQIREAVFGSITEEALARKAEFPEHENGVVKAPGTGKQFTREGAGRKDPVLNEEKLAALVGADTWKDVTVTEQIPAQTVVKLDMDLLLAAARTRPEIMECIRESLDPGAWKTPRLQVRDIKDIKDEEE